MFQLGLTGHAGPFMLGGGALLGGDGDPMATGKVGVATKRASFLLSGAGNAQGGSAQMRLVIPTP